MGRNRLLSVLTATVLAVGALSVPAAALELDSAVEETTGTVEVTAETVEETITGDDPVEDAVAAVEETATVVEDTAEDLSEDPVGTVEEIIEDPEDAVQDLVDPVADALPGSGDDDTQPADDGGVEPADDPQASADPTTGPRISTSPSFDRMLTAPEMDHGVAARPSTSRTAVAAPAEAPAETVELAPEVAVQAAAPEPGPLGLPADAVPALLRALTAMLVAGAMVTWRTVQQQLAD